jgi:Na+/phosphate symporter
MTTYIPLLAAIIGVLLYALSSNDKIREMGRIAFFCGLLVTLMQLQGHTLKLF